MPDLQISGVKLVELELNLEYQFMYFDFSCFVARGAPGGDNSTNWSYIASIMKTLFYAKVTLSLLEASGDMIF